MYDLTSRQKKNYAYFKLVNDSDDRLDFVGMIAYALYKREKIDYIVKYRKENNGNIPSEEELSIFQQGRCTDTAREHSRQHSEQMVKRFIEEYISQKSNNITEEKQKLEEKKKAIESQSSDLTKKENEWKKKLGEIKIQEKKIRDMEKICPKMNKVRSFWSGVLQSVVATFLFAVLTVIIALSIQFNWIEIIVSVFK